MKLISTLSLVFLFSLLAFPQTILPGLFPSSYFSEQTVTFAYQPEIRIHINAPSPFQFDPAKPIGLVLYALPNGNTIEQTVGKILEPGDDWHFDIQHIGAQTRFLRQQVEDYNVVSVYLETSQKSWPAWKAAHSNHAAVIKNLVEYLKSCYQQYNPFVVLTGHSGGGRFTFSFLDAFTQIPSYVKRISFLDSNYGYEHYYGDKIINWLNASSDNYLSVIAYNDSVALYNGQPIVSPTGGTWYRSRIMKNYMSQFFTFTNEEDDEFIKHTALNGRIKFILKKNPLRQILHTVQVEKNGHIQGMVSGTPDEGMGYIYYGSRAYSQWIQINVNNPAQLNIPPRNPNAKTGSEFMQYVLSMTFAQREDQIYNEISTGNIPNFLRSLKQIETTFLDANGVSHIIKYDVLPDYLAIGTDSDYCRIPIGPITAQRLADLFGAIMPTRKLVDNIYLNCDVKLQPVTYTPIGNQNELVPKFIQHNTAIDSQFAIAGGVYGQLTGGTKKDVVLSNKIIDPARPNHVTIYGWHQLNGQPIQPLTNIHVNTYVDYSHGIRFLNNEFLLDGAVKKINQILSDEILYKVLSDETGAMVQPTYISTATPPAKPKSFGIKSEGINKIRFLIKEDTEVESYLVYGSSDGINFNQPLSISSNNFTVDNLNPHTIYYIKLRAVNSLGSSADSEVLACKTGAENAILVVNGFDRASTGNSFNFIRQHAAALNEDSGQFNSCTNEAVTDGLFNLNDYFMVDYILGDESTVDETFSTEEQEKVKLFLMGGGKLFVSGSEIAWDLDYKGSASDKNFINNYLMMKYVADAPGGQSATHYQCTPFALSIFSGVPSFYIDDGTHGTIDVQWPDVVKAINGAYVCLTYNRFDTSYGYAGVYYSGYFNGGTYPGQIVVLGVPFETIYPEEIRGALMIKILSFFDIAVSVENGSSSIPDVFYLYQNYPNPFNPITTFKYDVPSADFISLTIYDILGQKVLRAVNDYQSAGTHELKFNASTLSSGIYIYELKAGNKFIQRKKMTLLK